MHALPVMKRLLFLLLFVSISAAAQTVDRNAVYLELGGNAIGPNINYERRWSDLWAFRVGFTYVEVSTETETDSAIAVPLMVNRISAPASNHHLETGLGILLVAGEDEQLNDEIDEEFAGVIGTLTVGYRYQKPAGGFVFRIGFTPIFDDQNFIPWGGMSFGYAW